MALGSLDEKKKTIRSAIDDLEKTINKFTRKWYFLFLIDIVIFLVIIVLTWLAIDVNAEVQKIVGTLGLTVVGVIIGVRTLYNNLQERTKWSDFLNQLIVIPDFLRRSLEIASSNEDIDSVENQYLDMIQVIFWLHSENKKKALEVLYEVVNRI